MPVFDHSAINPNSETYTTPDHADPELQTPESITSEVSHAGNVTQGTLEVVRDQVDRTGRATAAGILTNGNAGRLPAEGFGNRDQLAALITDPRENLTTALEATPFGSNAASTQTLNQAADTVNSFQGPIRIVGYAAAPVIGAIEGFSYSADDATFGEQFANSVGGMLQEFDDSAVSGFFGSAAGLGTTAIGGAMLGSGVGAPIGTTLIVSSPGVGASVAISTSVIYDNAPPDVFFDNMIENYIEPPIASFTDWTIEVLDNGITIIRNIQDSITNRIEELSD